MFGYVFNLPNIYSLIELQVHFFSKTKISAFFLKRNGNENVQCIKLLLLNEPYQGGKLALI